MGIDFNIFDENEDLSMALVAPVVNAEDPEDVQSVMGLGLKVHDVHGVEVGMAMMGMVSMAPSQFFALVITSLQEQGYMPLAQFDFTAENGESQLDELMAVPMPEEPIRFSPEDGLDIVIGGHGNLGDLYRTLFMLGEQDSSALTARYISAVTQEGFGDHLQSMMNRVVENDEIVGVLSEALGVDPDELREVALRPVSDAAESLIAASEAEKIVIRSADDVPSAQELSDTLGISLDEATEFRASLLESVKQMEGAAAAGDIPTSGGAKAQEDEEEDLNWD